MAINKESLKFYLASWMGGSLFFIVMGLGWYLLAYLIGKEPSGIPPLMFTIWLAFTIITIMVSIIDSETFEANE